MKKSNLFLYTIMPFFMACQALQQESVKIINNTENPIDFQYTVPEYSRADISITKLKRIDAQEILYKAIKNNSAEGIIIAVQSGANINEIKENKTPLCLSILLRRWDAAKTLIQCGANPNNQDQNSSLIMLALKMRSPKIALSLIQNDADFKNCANDCMRTSIELAMRSKDENDRNIALQIIQELLHRGYNVNDMWYLGPNHQGQVFTINETILNIMIKNGANVNHIFQQGPFRNSSWTPLVAFIIHGNTKMIEILLNAGAVINKPANPYPDHRDVNLRGFHTPLFFATTYEKYDIIELLVQYGAIL